MAEGAQSFKSGPVGSSSSKPSAEKGEGRLLQFAPFQSSVDEGFWHRLSSLKLDKLRLDDSPIEITGNPSLSLCALNYIAGNRAVLEMFCRFVGLFDFRTECFSLPSSISQCLSNSQPKKHEIDLLQISNHLTLLAESLPPDTHEQLSSTETIRGNRNKCPVPGVLYNTNTMESFQNLDRQNLLKMEAKKIWDDIRSGKAVEDPAVLSRFLLISFADLKKWSFHYWFAFPALSLDPPATLLDLRPALECFTKEEIEKIHFLCYREKHGLADLGFSLVGEALVSLPEGRDAQDGLAKSAADLNLKLMRWRTLPSLNLDALSDVKCLLLGAGTLGCQVARMLMAWGVRKITLLDSGRVAMSNPLRQSLYTLEDCLNGGDMKAIAAVRSLNRIFPAVEAAGVAMAIPMPGHPVPLAEEASVLDDCMHLENLILSHDVTFLLTDTRESRWLPTLLCANANKIAITAALGFDSFLVMRHGAGPYSSMPSNFHGDGKKAKPKDTRDSSMELSTADDDGSQRLGCYFCNDVVAPIDSTSNRTLDQQCTVTRPGLAPIASALAVELLVGILHHPDGIYAHGEIFNSRIGTSSDRPLGILPHQIRGFLSQFSQLTLLEYRRRGMNFVLQAINQPSYLEDVTGLTELMKSANSFEVDWDNDDDDDDI
ncbi:hypothetical protein ACLOJK_002574 [Asimina triloba]